MKTCFVTNCYWVNFRSVPNANTNNTIIAAIPYRHECTSLDESDTWWKIKTEINNVPLVGYIHSDYLTHTQHNFSLESEIVHVHLTENRDIIKPIYDGYRASPLGDSNRIKGNMSSSSSKVSSIPTLGFLKIDNEILKGITVESYPSFLRLK